MLCCEIFFSTVLPPPQFFTSSPTNDSIVVSWAPVDNAVQYTVSIHKFGFNTEIKYNTSDTNLTVSGLEAGLLYMIKSSAWDPIGRNGEDSLYKNQTTREFTFLFLIWYSVSSMT